MDLIGTITLIAQEEALLTWTNDAEGDGVEPEESVGATVDIGAAFETSTSTINWNKGVWVDPCVV